MARRVFAHADADGVTSAYFIVHYAEEQAWDVIFPSEFGGTDELNPEPTDIMVDMTPLDPNFPGLVIDHHNQHPETHAYWLIFDHVPASVITWRHVGEPDDWKVVVGAVGDGQPEAVPPTIWLKHPILLKDIETYHGYKGNPFSLPLYKLLSSGINALCRIGEPFEAYQILSEAESPFDLLDNDEVIEARNTIRQETNHTLNNLRTVEVLPNVMVGEISSPHRIEGIIASKLYQDNQKTYLIHNRNTGAFALRGDLASLVEAILKEKGVRVGGHLAFKGGYAEESVFAILKEWWEVR